MEEAHPSASNALLKTLEEPNPQVVLVLTASDAEALLPTIVSRCEVLRLRPITANLLSQSLQTHLKYPPSEADFLASISNGRPGYALYLRDNQGMLDQRKEWLGDLLHLLSANRVERYAYAESHTPDPRKDREKEREKLRILIQHILPLWISLWRDVLLQVLHDSAALSNPDFQAQTNALANSLNQEKVHLLIRQTEQTLANLKRNVNPKLAMEVLLLDLPHLPQAVFA
jgi:DNA polymerase-3 subunit delta'